MKIFISIFLIFFIAQISFGQTHLIYNNDTINRMDMESKKQGKWIVFGKMKPGGCYSEDQKIEEGFYKENRKVGVWRECFCNGNLKNKITFYNGRPDGMAFIYNENGSIREYGVWKINRWRGNYYNYDESGKLAHMTKPDSAGHSRKWTTTYFSKKGHVLRDEKWESEIKREGRYSIESNSSQADTTKIYSHLISEKMNSQKPLILNGNHTLYNKNKQITKDGIFHNNQFMDGKAYLYNEKSELTRVAVYKNGIYVGDAQIEK